MEIKTKFNLGEKAEDKVSGFKGVIIGFCCYITGCYQYLLIPRSKDDGSYNEGRWFDEDRLVLTGETKIEINNVPNSGCDIPPPIK